MKVAQSTRLDSNQQLPFLGEWRNGCSFILVFALCVGFALRIFLSRGTPLVHPDEIFQQLEPAHKLAFGYGVVTWEWREGIRSWVLPSFFAVVMKLSTLIHDDPAFYLIAIKIVLSILSLPVIWAAYAWARHFSGRGAAGIAACGTAVWHQLVVYASHSLSEVVATDFLLPGTYLLLCAPDNLRKRVLGALLCGFAVALRIQLLPIMLIIAFFSLVLSPKPGRIGVALGMIAPLLMFGLIDWPTLGLPFQSYWKYIWVNVVEGASKRFGVLPWYWYLERIAEQYGPILLLTIAGARRSPLLATFCCVEIGFMSIIAHKEDRFIYPVAPYMIVLAALGFFEVFSFAKRRFAVQLGEVEATTYSIAVIAACSLALWPEYQFRGARADGMTTLLKLSRRADVCGVELRQVPWFMAGGYTYLHKQIPMVVGGIDGFEVEHSAFNVVVSEGTFNKQEGSGYTLRSCEGETCTYDRLGICNGNAYPTINEFLKKTGN